METRANHILIGAFVLLAVAAGFAFVYWASDLGYSRATRSYSILFAGSIQSLNKSSDVLFNGLKVGKVRRIRIDEADTRRVLVVVWVDPDTPVRQNSHASIVQQGLTGITAVQISPGTPDSPLMPGGLEGPYPVITSDAALASTSLSDALPELMGKANSVLTRLNDLIADNQSSVHNAVRDLETFAGSLKANNDDVTAIIRNVRVFTDDLASVKATLASIDTAVAKVSGLLDRNEKAIDTTLANTAEFTQALNAKREDVAAIIGNMKGLSEDLKRVSGKLESTLDQASGLLGGEGNASIMENARQAVEAFKSLAVKLDQSLVGSDGLTETARRSLQEFERFMRSGSKAAASLERTLDNLDRNPQSLLFGSKKVPEYTPQ